MNEPRLPATPIWKSDLGYFARFRIWRQGGRRVYRGWTSYHDISPILASHGVEVVPYRIDVESFWQYVDQVGYRGMGYWGGGKERAATEKWLEHFVSIDLLQPRPGDVLVDIASCYSPFPDIMREHHGCHTYRQDWLYPPGCHGDRIGGDAASLPVADGFADLLVLHCSFDHFEGDRDQLFLREAARVLKPGGRLCILPLYTNTDYCIQTDLAAWHLRRPTFQRDALICLAEGWGEVHCRFYDAAHFLERIAGNVGDMKLRLFRVENYREVADDCYLWFAAVFTKPALAGDAAGAGRV